MFRDRPNLARLLLFVALLAVVGGVGGAMFDDPDKATAASQPGAVVTPPARPVPVGPPAAAKPTPRQDCVPNSTGVYVGTRGSVQVLCELNNAGTLWQWGGLSQSQDSYTYLPLGTTQTDSTGAVWQSRTDGSGVNLWVWMPNLNTNWHPPTASYPHEGVTPGSN